MPRELIDVNAQFISLVKKGANKQELVLYKSADFEQEQPAVEQEVKTPVVKKEGLLDKVIKAVTSVMKAEEAPSFLANMKKSQTYNNLWDAYYVMQDTMYDILWWNTSDSPKADLEKELNAFRDFVLENVTELGFTKSAEFAKERKVAKADENTEVNLDPIKSAVSELNATLEKMDKTLRKGDDDMDLEKLQEVLKATLEPLTKGVDELKIQMGTMEEKVSGLEKSAEETEAKVEKTEEKVEKTEEKVEEAVEKAEKSVEEIVKSAVEGVATSVGAITKSVAELGERLTKMENARTVANASNESTEVKKSADPFQNVFKF